MKAVDVMSTSVVAVTPEYPARSIALLLLRNGISAVPVVGVLSAWSARATSCRATMPSARRVAIGG